MLRQRLSLAVLAVWLAVSLARLSRLVEPPETPPGQDAADSFDFFRAHVPPEAAYLYVLPGQFGADTGLGPRLRYELYPRRYDDLRASLDEDAARALIRQARARYVVVPQASEYAAEHWTRAPREWLRRVELDAQRYLLEVAP
ncbi:MAG: hypothetical protein M3336_09325 [Chloroflexota bacterium]|nr:hypothetical protein [Chloroflexota bacterium]